MKNWEQYFVPECFFDTVLFKKILQTNKRLVHAKGCNNVVNHFKIINGRKGHLHDKPFGVGMIDKDKKELDYLNECKEILIKENIILWKHIHKNHYIIQLNPPIEKWILKILNDSKMNIEEYGYSSDFKKLKKEIKNDIDDENDSKLNKLISAILTLNHTTITMLKQILLYLKNKNEYADPEEIKQIICN